MKGRVDYISKKVLVLIDRFRLAAGLPAKRPELVGDLSPLGSGSFGGSQGGYGSQGGQGGFRPRPHWRPMHRDTVCTGGGNFTWADGHATFQTQANMLSSAGASLWTRWKD